MAVVIYNKKLDVWTPGAHAGTLRGNQLAMKAGTILIKKVSEPDFLSDVKRKGQIIIDRLTALKNRVSIIGDVRGLGLMIGVRTERPVADVLADLRAEGVLALKAHDKLRLLPPLNIPDELLDEAVGKIVKVCAK